MILYNTLHPCMYFDGSVGSLVCQCPYTFFPRKALSAMAVVCQFLFQQSVYRCHLKQSYGCVLILYWFFIRRWDISSEILIVECGLKALQPATLCFGALKIYAQHFYKTLIFLGVYDLYLWMKITSYGTLLMTGKVLQNYLIYKNIKFS